MFAMAAVPALALLVGAAVIPESPRWLAKTVRRRCASVPPRAWCLGVKQDEETASRCRNECALSGPLCAKASQKGGVRA
jgi:hypothetical protein